MNTVEITPVTQIVSDYFGPTGELEHTQTVETAEREETVSARLLLDIAQGIVLEGAGLTVTHTTADGDIITGTVTETGSIITREFPDGDRQVVTLTRIQDLAAA